MKERKEVKSLSCVQLFATLWTVARQAPLSTGFSRQEYGSGLPFPPPGDLPDPGIEPMCLKSPAVAGGFFTPEPSGKPDPRHFKNTCLILIPASWHRKLGHEVPVRRFSIM